MRSLLLVSLLSLGGCAAEAGEDPGKVWKYAEARPDCAPWDGAATTVLLSDAVITPDPARPYLRISAWVGLPAQEIRADVETSGSGGMSAGWCESGDSCTYADRGWVRLRPAGGKLNGEYQLHLPDGRALAGSFSATVIPQPQLLCG